MPVEELTVRVWTDPVSSPDLPARPPGAPQLLGIVDIITHVTEPTARPQGSAMVTGQLVTRLASFETFGTFPGLGVTVALWLFGIFPPLSLISFIIITETLLKITWTSRSKSFRRQFRTPRS